MIADEPPLTPSIGSPDALLLDADRFYHRIIEFIEQELPVWRDRPSRPQVTDEPNLNQTLCIHLNSAARHQCFDSVQFIQEAVQAAGRRADIAVMPLGTIMVEGRSYEDFEQLLPIECKRLPTPADSRRSDCEYVHGVPGHRTGAIERFKHRLHGGGNTKAMIIAYIQAEPFGHWWNTINARLEELDRDGRDSGLWSPTEPLNPAPDGTHVDVQRFVSQHKRISAHSDPDQIEIRHLWLRMN